LFTSACDTLLGASMVTGAHADKKKDRNSRGSVDGKAQPQKLKLDVETMSLLSKLKLTMPSAVAEVPALQQAAAAKKAGYEAKQKQALENGDEDAAEEEEPATPTVDSEKGGAKRGQKGRGGAGAAGASDCAQAVSVTMRCDEAFGMVLVELTAQ
jgi:hypothetical protein